MLFLALPAFADGYSTDIELVRPTFSPGAIAGIDTPILARPGTVRVGSLFQYERDPLLLYQLEREAGSVVANRFMAQLGVSVDFTKRLSARLVLPIGGNWGSEVNRLAGDVGGIGDATIGARVFILHAGPLDLAARADIYLPFGTPNAYLGETGLRGSGGVLAQGKLGPVALLADIGILGRAPVETSQDFTLGSELQLSGGARLDIWADHASIGAGVISRAGIATLGTGAETPVELVADAQLRPARDWRVNVGFGRGLAAGYGTTQLRVMAGVTWQRAPVPPERPEPDPQPRMVVSEAPDLPTLAEIEQTTVEIEPPVWKDDELARMVESQIVIRDPIQFELATNKVLPESIPTLHAVAKILAEHPEIGHLVIEGHASEEGSFAYNYDLSIKRSLAVFQELVLAGTWPERLSCRGMGEVQPITLGSDEAALAKNRRVIFHIVRRLKAGEQPAMQTPEMLLPWSGDPKTFAAPPPIPEPAPPPEEAKPKRPPPSEEKDYPTNPDVFEEDEEEENK